MRKRFTLTEQEIHSALWKKLSAHYAHKLDMRRKDNDGNHDAIVTAKLRGRIEELVDFLALGKPAPDQETDDG